MNQYQNTNQNYEPECAKGNHPWVGIGMAPKFFRCIACGEVKDVPETNFGDMEQAHGIGKTP